MPLVEFDPEEKQGSPFDFPKLKLRHGEQARLAFLQEKPLADFVHVFRAPVIINGRAETEQVQQRDGSAITRMKMSFIRQVVCKGDYGTLKDKGLDPQNCPACAASTKNSDAIPQPQRRFAANVVRYQTKPGGWEVAEPYQVSVAAWAFPQRTFDKLITLLQEQGGEQKLYLHDLLLGPCENEGFQKFEILMSNRAEWITTDDRKRHTVEAWKNNQAPNLAVFLGQKRTAEEIMEDVQVVLMRHRQAQGITTPEAQVDEGSVDSLLDEMNTSPPPAAEPEAAPATSPVDDLLSVEAAPPAPNGDESTAKTFEELLGQIDEKE